MTVAKTTVAKMTVAKVTVAMMTVAKMTKDRRQDVSIEKVQLYTSGALKGHKKSDWLSLFTATKDNSSACLTRKIIF